ncbi:MAG: type II toxin-antitoxin system RelE/ParE family toxin [Gammaproteobacteria bacterium]|nr:type II toxin-antitoxin system RelE/ParE family toxin [Gammaproteobacteria bacterium]
MMKWRISGPARHDLGGVWAYTASTWGVEQADRYVDSLTMRMAWLSKNEAEWHKRGDIRDGLFAYPEGRHVIFFEASVDILSVIRVLHQRMDVVRHVK